MIRAALLSGLLAAGPAAAAEFEVVDWRNHDVLLMTGRIDAGTAEKFERVIEQVGPLPHGLPVLLLDSPGGDVNEAMRMAALMDAHPFHTVIYNGASCASACAVVVFIAGALRTVDPGGALGQHSCAVGGVPRQDCNERLAQFAVAHGVSHGSVAAFVTNVAPKDILWFSRQDSDGWGLTKYPGEEAVGWAKSEPRVFRQILGQDPPPQGLWRLDFRGDGYEAFIRQGRDDERELELNLFCDETLPGRLFLSLEIHGPEEVISGLVSTVRVETGRHAWEVGGPVVMQMDEAVSEVVFEVAPERIRDLLTVDEALHVVLPLPQPYTDIEVRAPLAESRANLLFAANHCMNQPR